MTFILPAVPLIAAQIAWGQGVGAPLGGTTTSHISNGIGWDIPEDTLPSQPVIRDPAGQPWFKDLYDITGGPVNAAPGDTFSIRERLLIDGTLDWSDWHEEILNPGWEWDLASAFFFADGAAAPGLVVSGTPSTATTGGTISFDFDPLPPGTEILIGKQLVYKGDAIGSDFAGIVHLAEYPTPEPSAALLMAMSGLVFLRRRRARRR
jgi:hypothetical protein